MMIVQIPIQIFTIVAHNSQTIPPQLKPNTNQPKSRLPSVFRMFRLALSEAQAHVQNVQNVQTGSRMFRMFRMLRAGSEPGLSARLAARVQNVQNVQNV